MDNLERLEAGVGNLLAYCQELRRENIMLLGEKKQWTQERRELLQEIDGVLERLNKIHLEDT